MYLANFSAEKKQLFLELDLIAANCDEEFSDEEQFLIDAHCAEMNIGNNNYERHMDLNTVLNSMKQTYEPEELRMAFLEILTMIMADDVIVPDEENLIISMRDVFGFEPDAIEKGKAALVAYREANEKLYSFIDGI